MKFIVFVIFSTFIGINPILSQKTSDEELLSMLNSKEDSDETSIQQIEPVNEGSINIVIRQKGTDKSELQKVSNLNSKEDLETKNNFKIAVKTINKNPKSNRANKSNSSGKVLTGHLKKCTRKYEGYTTLIGRSNFECKSGRWLKLK